MGVKKGMINNPAGRPPGSKNKATADIRRWISKVIDQNSKQLERDMKELKPAERWTIIEKIMQYVTPKCQAVAAQVDFDKLSEEQIDRIIGVLIKQTENENNY